MKKISWLSLCILYVFLFFLSSRAMGEEFAIRSYSLPEHGSIQLKAPASWVGDLRQPPNRLPPTIAFKPRSGSSFEILLTPIWQASKDDPLPNSEKIKQLVLQAAERAKLKSVETTLQVRELKGASGNAGNGYYFSATDGAPEPNGYKYMTQGTIRVGDLMVMFTLLTNDGQGSVINDALSMLKSATHVKGNTT